MALILSKASDAGVPYAVVLNSTTQTASQLTISNNSISIPASSQQLMIGNINHISGTLNNTGSLAKTIMIVAADGTITTENWTAGNKAIDTDCNAFIVLSSSGAIDTSTVTIA